MPSGKHDTSATVTKIQLTQHNLVMLNDKLQLSYPGQMTHDGRGFEVLTNGMTAADKQLLTKKVNVK